MDIALLEMRGIVKSFPGVRALDGVDFTLRRGEIHSIMGENGAGKSTLIKVLTGVYRRDNGNVTLDHHVIHPRSPLDAQKLGISTVYQEVNLIPQLSVAENIYLGRQPRRLGCVQWRRLNAEARAALARLDIDLDVTQSLNSYSIAIQQMVAIARALGPGKKLCPKCGYDLRGSERTCPECGAAVEYAGAGTAAKVLVLDEPTSSLDADEVQQLFTVMRQLKAQGLGIVFISHFLEQVYAMSDRFTVLRNGKLIGAYEASKLSRLELVSKMIGKDVEAVKQMSAHHGAPPAQTEHRTLLEAKGLGRRGSIEPMDFELRSGEVAGFAGLLGSGRTETARLLFGIDRADTGTLRVDGQPVHLNNPRRAIALRFGFLPEDRKTQAIVPELSIRENIVLALQARRGWTRRLAPVKQRALADHYIKALHIATPDAEKPIGQLSGGNQQKAIIARWLASEPRLLILDEPTRGIDVGAKAEIEKLVRDLCQKGLAIVFISSELEEVVRDSHRVMVLRDRRKIGELTGEQIDLKNIMHLIADAQ